MIDKPAADNAPPLREWKPTSFFVPPERNGRFFTRDGDPYQRLQNGQIVRLRPKVRGKAARKAERAARRVGVRHESISTGRDVRPADGARLVTPPSMGGGHR